MKKCERCHKKYQRDYDNEIVVFPNVCNVCEKKLLFVEFDK